MEISSQTNSFQAMNTYEKPITTPVETQENLVSQNEESVQKQSQTQEQQDTQKGVAVDYLGAKAEQSQTEIYLAVATQSEESSKSSTASAVESLRNVQKQNNAVEAYAAYKENQINPVENFARGLAE